MSTTSTKTTTQLLPLIQEALESVKAIDIKLFNLCDISPCFDFAFVASGSSTAHNRGILEKLNQKVPKKPSGIEGRLDNNWLLLDYGAIIVHLFIDDLRPSYDIEKLYQGWINDHKKEPFKKQKQLP